MLFTPEVLLQIFNAQRKCERLVCGCVKSSSLFAFLLPELRPSLLSLLLRLLLFLLLPCRLLVLLPVFLLRVLLFLRL